MDLRLQYVNLKMLNNAKMYEHITFLINFMSCSGSRENEGTMFSFMNIFESKNLIEKQSARVYRETVLDGFNVVLRDLKNVENRTNVRDHEVLRSHFEASRQWLDRRDQVLDF